MADEFLTPDPDDPQLQSGGIPISDIPESKYAPVDLTIETLQGPELEERERKQAEFANEQMAAVGIEEKPPAPPPDIDQYLFNEIAPPRATLTTSEVYDVRPPSEKEAREAMNQIVPGKSDAEIANAERIVSRHLEAQKADDQARTIQHVQGYYTSEERRKELAKHPDMANGIALSPDPELFEQTSINNAWINAMMGRKLSAPELEVRRKAIGKELFNIPDISDQQFFSKMQEYAKGKEAEQDLLDKLDAAVGAHVLTDQLNRTYTPDFAVLEKLKAENPDVVTPENERTFALANQRMHGRMRQMGDRLLEPYSEIFQVVQRAAKEKRDPTPEELTGIVDTLSAIDPEDRQEIWGLVGRAGRSGLIDPKGLAAVMDNLGKSWGREFNISDRSMRDQQTLMDNMLKQLDAGAKFGMYRGRFVYAPPGQDLIKGATELDKEGYQEYRGKLQTGIKGIDLLWEAQQAYESIVDPIRPVFKKGLLSVGESGLYALPGMAKLALQGGAIPGPVGWTFMFNAIRAEEYRTARIANPHMDVEATARMAAISAALQAIPEQMQIEIPLGRFGLMKSIERDITQAGFLGGARAYGKRALVGLAGENLIEGFQDAVSMFYPAIQSQFDPNMTRQDLGEVAWQWLSTRPEVFAAVLLPAGIGAGVVTYHELKNPLRSVFNTETMRGLGLKEDAIERVLGQETFDEMQSAFIQEYHQVTPEERARGHDYISATAAAEAVKQVEGNAPSFHTVKQADGTKVFEVRDAEGNVVFSSTDSDLAQSAYVDLVTTTTAERLAAEETLKKGAEGIVAGAESEGTVRLLDEPSRTSASVMLDFTPNERPTPELAGSLGRLEAALAKDPRGAGKGIKLVAVDPVERGATPAGQRFLTAIRAIEGLFGKKVVFVRSVSGDALPFTGIVSSSDPNTIFLDADGDRNVLALLGHEFSHTLARDNPTVYKAMVAQMRPLVRDWLNQEAKLRDEEGYTDAQVTDELVGNIIGDSFTRPEFWAALNERNPSLFEKMVKIFEDWWNNLVEAIRGSEWGTEEFINNLTEMHGVISDAINEARQSGPEAGAAMPAEGEVSIATRRIKEAAEASEFAMEIERGVREVAAIGHYSEEERAKVEGWIKAALDKNVNIPKRGKRRDAIRAQLLTLAEEDIRATRIYNPDKIEPKTETTTGVTSPWASIELTGVKVTYTPADPTKPKSQPVFKAVSQWKTIYYSYDQPPPGVSKAEWAETLAQRMVDQFFDRINEGGPNAKTILAQIGWYRNLIVKLDKDFGGFADMFADFLGAFSPMQQVDQNWLDAIVFLKQVTNGKYDDLFKELDAWVAGGQTIKQWRDAGKPIPLKEDDLTKFAQNTNNGLLAVLDMWREVQKGDSPKARNFTKNLIGLSIKATIDRWAGRTLQRLAEKPRIPLKPAEGDVAGLHISPEEVGGAFGFGQEVFRIANAKMIERDPVRFAGLIPSDLQAMNWYVEKEIWGKNNWSNKKGEGGSFDQRIIEQNVQRFVIGLAQTVQNFAPWPDYTPTTAENVAFGTKVRNDIVARIAKKGQFLAVRAKDSVGMYKKDRERTLDTEILTGPNIEPMDILRIAATHAWTEHQKSTFVARVIKDWEKDNPNARPGLEIYFSRKLTPEEVQPIMVYLEARNINGFTAVIDQRAKPNPTPGAGEPDFLYGVRFMYIPEYDDLERARKNWAEAAAEIHEVLRSSYAEIAKIPGVRSVLMAQYDTVVLKTGADYDERGIIETSPGREFAEGWRERFLHANATPATSKLGVFQGEGIGPSPVPGRGEEPVRGPPGPSVEGEVSFATRRGKFEGAKREGVSKEESVAAAFEALHAEPEKRLQLFQKVKAAFEKAREAHRVAEARVTAQAPPQQDATAEIEQLEAVETKELEDLDIAEQDALDRSSQEIADRYGERILAETDPVKRRALERESKAVAAEKRKGIEKQFTERRKAIEADFRRQQQAVRVRVEQANLAATKEGAAELAETQRLHTFAELNAMLKALPPDIRGRIGPVLSLAQVRATEAGMADFLTKQIGKIEEAIEGALKREYTGRIKKLLAQTEPKTTPTGIKKSAIGPEAQHATDLARKAVKMDNDQTSTRLAVVEAALNAPEITEEEQANLIEEWTILNSFGDLDTRNAESLASAYDWLNEIVSTGRSAWRLKEEKRATKMQGIRNEIITGLGKGTRAGLTKKDMEQGAVATLDSFGLTHSNFLQFLARILPADTSFMVDWMNRVRRSDNKAQDMAIAAGDRLMAHMRSTLGISSRGAMANTVWKLKEPVEGKVTAYDGRVLDKDGNVVSPGKLEKLTMSRLEAIQFLLSWNQPDAREKMINQGWTEESATQMQDLTKDRESQAVLAFLQKEFGESYAISNPLYRELFGMNMPQVKNYAPTRFKATRDAGDIAPHGAPLGASGLTPGYAKARVNHSAMMDQVDALNVFWQHIAQQAHWTNFAEITRELRSVLGNRDVRAAIEQAHGKMTLQLVDQWIETIANAGGNKSAELIVNNRILSALISGKAMSSLGFNLRTIFAQVDSMMRVVFAMPMGRIAKAILDPKFLSNIPKVWKSDTIQRRIKSGGSPEARYLFEQTRLRPSTLLRMGRASMMPIQLTDAGLTTLSSAVVFTDSYKQAKAAGRTDEEAASIAADDADDAVYRYSQPTGIGSRSLQELTGGQTKKAFMLFMSDARLKSALYAEAAKNIMSGKGKKMDWYRVAAVHVMAGISQIVINAYRDTFTDDDDDEIWTAGSMWKAVLLGPLQGFYLVGTAGDAIASRLLGERFFAPSRDPLLDAIASGGRALQNLDKLLKPEDTKAFMRELNDIARLLAVHPMTAAPAVIINFLKPIFGLWENLEKTED